MEELEGITDFKLAIVIPGYKNIFIENTLESIANQTNKNFTVYIGDDNSPHDLGRICREYCGKIRLVYRRFDENLGGTNLVNHWNRCLEMVADEEWIWLFSDDDILDENCVQNFYDEIAKSKDIFDVYHFDINIIGENNQILSSQNQFPEVLHVKDFILKRSVGCIKSYVVEYIFNRTVLENLGGFVNFPIAWHSDEATVIFGASKTGIKTIRGGRVNWRSSEFNITPNSTSLKVVEQKIKASKEFSIWLQKFLDTNDIRLNRGMSYYLIKRFCYELHLYRKCISMRDTFASLKEYIHNLRLDYWYPFSLLILLKFHILNKR
ncbi:glycosyltransferase family 2 protein [Sphingobacterium gobiense]|uniref:Glycosyl transferase family A n=1 Tax=Sphingobacterium gobiense TaxID=1382456 RepID=A0A2S9JG29_9SPHI|nr:glycosyltransferase [Sphingobacterium gobiense]PRD51914.1 glycosyl transferase family A [Sphingobacterium gobiense]